MIIGIDGNEANVDERVGVNEYAFELLWGLHRTKSEWSSKHCIIVYLKNTPLPDLPPESDCLKYCVINGKGNWIMTRLMPSLFLGVEHVDVLFSPSHYLPLFSPVPLVCSIMDIGYLMFSEQFKKRDYWQLKLWTAISITISKGIIAISNATGQDIVRHYPWASRKIDVTYLAYDKDIYNQNIPTREVDRVKKKYSIVSEYLLFISTLKPSKNVEGLLKAYKLLRERHDKPPVLVIVGKKGWLYETIFTEVKRLGLVDQVIFTGFIPEEDKHGLIFGAKALVLPSFWEGFGLDPLKAMACGTPVVVSDVASLPEVVGNAGILVDPAKPESIASGIQKVLSLNKMEYNSLKAIGIKQANKFSWEKTARQTISILEKTQR